MLGPKKFLVQTQHMNEEIDKKLLFKLGQTQLDKANDTIRKISEMQETTTGRAIMGLSKLKKRVKAERDFLQSVHLLNISPELKNFVF